MNAWFYISWMLANIVFLCIIVPTTTLHAISSAQQALLMQRIRFTILLALVTSIGADSVLQFDTKQV